MAEAAKPAKLEAGLVGSYEGGGRKVVRVVGSPNFVLGAGEGIHPQVPVGEFSVVYEGVIRVLKEGEYSIWCEGGGEVLVGGKEVKKGKLGVGDHEIRIAYARKAGADARLQLWWESGEFAAEPVPGRVLGHVGELSEEGKRSVVVERGRVLVQELNCVGCHAAAGQLSGRVGPDLSGVGGRVNAGWVVKWLEGSRRFRAGALMPVVLKTEQERWDVAAYLGTLKGEKSEVRSQKSEADAKKGKEVFEAVGCVNCHGGEKGVSLNGMASKWGSVRALADYLVDPLKVDPSGRMPEMLLSQTEADALALFLFEGGNGKDYLIEGKVGGREEVGRAHPTGDRERGRDLVRKTGCLNCHSVEGEKSELTPPAALEKVNGAECRGVTYELAGEEKEAVAAYLDSIKKQPEGGEAAPVYALSQHMAQLRCGACHGAVAGEGVPSLEVAGEKLKGGWMERVLLEKKRVRPWVRVRMPHFGEGVESLGGEIAAGSGVGESKGERRTSNIERPTSKEEAVAVGRKLVGLGGYSCIACHSVNGGAVAAPEQSRGPELTTMTMRLRGEWFERWVREPGRISPSTVMPSFFGSKTREEAHGEIGAMWEYLAMGKWMPTPNGAGQGEVARFVLSAGEGPVVQRCFLDGDKTRAAVARAVAVGLPGGISYVFDPEVGRVRDVWRGGFVDMTWGWNGRGSTHGYRMGGEVVRFGEGPVVYVGSMGKAPVVRYRGYEVKKDGVEIQYEVDGVEVRETITAREGVIVRTFTFGEAKEGVYLVFEAGMGLEASVGKFEEVSPPAGWGAGAKVVAVKVNPGVEAVSVTIKTNAEAK